MSLYLTLILIWWKSESSDQLTFIVLNFLIKRNDIHDLPFTHSPEIHGIVREAFRTEIVKGDHFKIVDAEHADEHTLIMRGVVADIVSRVPPESVGRMNLYMSTVGGATLGLEFLDGTTGEVLARVADRGRIGDARGQIDRSSRPVNRATVIGEVKRWANGAARKLRAALDSALESK